MSLVVILVKDYGLYLVLGVLTIKLFPIKSSIHGLTTSSSLSHLTISVHWCECAIETAGS